MRNSKALMEIFKSLLIVFLSLSALFLFFRNTSTEMYFWRQETETETHAFQGVESGAPSIVPSILAAQMGDMRYLAAPLETEIIFQERLGTFLREALAQLPEQQSFVTISAEIWEKTLRQDTWIYYDFKGEMPLSLYQLAFLGERNLGDTMVRRFLISTSSEGGIFLSLADDNGQYYRVKLAQDSMGRMGEVLGTLAQTGGEFAFETDYDYLANTVIFPHETYKIPQLSQGIDLSISQSQEEEILSILGFNPKALVEYETSDGVGIREGDDSLRISKDGGIHFSTSEDLPSRYVTGSQNLGDEILYCQLLFEKLIKPLNSPGSLYLSAYEEGENGALRLEFSYLVCGSVVTNMPQNYAGVFELSQGRISAFDLYLRSYAIEENFVSILPLSQAFSMVDAATLPGKELFLSYVDLGEGGRLSVQWGIKGQ